MADRLAPIAALDVPLSEKLTVLREASLTAGVHNEVIGRWAAEHPAIAKVDGWYSRAWWGAAAGEIVRDQLFDRGRHAEALALVDEVDDTALVDARRQGKGVIVVTAHIGPPKFLMNWLVDQGLPLLVWTNTGDLPAWQAASGDARFVDPRTPDDKSVVLVNAAIHLRRGGVLLGAADMGTGGRVVTIERLGYVREFSLGLPALARRLDVPAVTGLALWHGDRIRIRFVPLEPPSPGLSEDEWNQAWLDRSWAVVEPVLGDSPENLRFLRKAVERLSQPQGAEGR